MFNRTNSNSLFQLYFGILWKGECFAKTSSVGRQFPNVFLRRSFYGSQMVLPPTWRSESGRQHGKKMVMVGYNVTYYQVTSIDGYILLLKSTDDFISRGDSAKFNEENIGFYQQSCMTIYIYYIPLMFFTTFYFHFHLTCEKGGPMSPKTLPPPSI